MVKRRKRCLRVAGGPTGGSSGNTCEADGIAIFTIGLNLAKDNSYNKLKDHQQELLDEKRPQSGQLGGIAWRAGHGSRYYPCENLTELKNAFSEIARHYTQGQ